VLVTPFTSVKGKQCVITLRTVSGVWTSDMGFVKHVQTKHGKFEGLVDQSTL